MLKALVEMEEDNLFLIKHVAEEDQSLDEMWKLKEVRIKQQKHEINKADKSIKDLKENTRELVSRNSAVIDLQKQMMQKHGDKQ